MAAMWLWELEDIGEREMIATQMTVIKKEM